MCYAGCKGPWTESKTADANLDYVFLKKHLLTAILDSEKSTEVNRVSHQTWLQAEVYPARTLQEPSRAQPEESEGQGVSSLSPSLLLKTRLEQACEVT